MFWIALAVALLVTALALPRVGLVLAAGVAVVGARHLASAIDPARFIDFTHARGAAELAGALLLALVALAARSVRVGQASRASSTASSLAVSRSSGLSARP